MPAADVRPTVSRVLEDDLHPKLDLAAADVA
jgi:hypothetical protein